MTLWQIDEQIAKAIELGFDPETGEVLDESALELLQMDRDIKIENIILALKNILAENKAIREEEMTLAKRRRTGENRAEWLKNYLSASLNGEKFSTPRCAASFRKSQGVKVLDENVLPADFLRVKTEPNTAAIKDAIKSGVDVPGAVLEDRMNIIIK